MGKLAIDGLVDDPGRPPARQGEPFICLCCSQLVVPVKVDETQPVPKLLPAAICDHCWGKIGR